MSAALEQAALAAKQAGRLEEAARLFAEQVRLQPKAHVPLYNLGNTLLALGRLADAVEAFRRAVRLAPRFAPAHNNLGMAQLQLDEIAYAAASFARAAALDPANPASQFLAGHALLRLDKPGEALAYLQRAERLVPNDPVTLTDLADALRRLGRSTEVLAPAHAAAQLAPARIEVWNNLANAERGLGNLAEAEAASLRALALVPGDADAHYNLALTLLAAGRWEEAWPHWEYRFLSVTKAPAPVPGPLWNGADLGEGVLYLRAEQGLGDTIQFCRYAVLARPRTRVVLAVQKPLLRLLGCLEGITLCADHELPPGFAAQAPLLSLPGVFGTAPHTVPMPTPYLRAEPARQAFWQQRLADLAGLRVGLVWAGNPGFPFDHLRSLPAASLAPLAAVAGVSFVSLQLGARDKPPFKIADFTAELTDFAETAALIANLDLVIGVDTAVIHLASALGVPTWLANRFDGDWRWGASGDTSPWYETLRIFRQGPERDWAPVLAAMAVALAQRAARPGP